MRTSVARRGHGTTDGPQIFFGDESIGGYDELAAIDKSGALAEKLK